MDKEKNLNYSGDCFFQFYANTFEYLNEIHALLGKREEWLQKRQINFYVISHCSWQQVTPRLPCLSLKSTRLCDFAYCWKINWSILKCLSLFEKKWIRMGHRQTGCGSENSTDRSSGETLIEKRVKQSKEIIWLAVA